jgi:hypothetical protein
MMKREPYYDGDEEDYMAVNPAEWLSSTMEACCQKFFGGYNYDACMGRYPPAGHGFNQGCTDDGKEPYYMLFYDNKCHTTSV